MTDRITSALKQIAESSCECGADASQIAQKALAELGRSPMAEKLTFQVFEWPANLYYEVVWATNRDGVKEKLDDLRAQFKRAEPRPPVRRVLRFLSSFSLGSSVEDL